MCKLYCIISLSDCDICVEICIVLIMKECMTAALIRSKDVFSYNFIVICFVFPVLNSKCKPFVISYNINKEKKN